MKHAKYSPSGYHRWKRCPASFHLQKEEVTESAIKGDIIHECLSLVLTHDMSIRQAFADVVKDVDITLEEVESMLYPVLDYIRLREEELNFMCDIKSEAKVVYSNDCWGTVDVLIQSFDRVEIIDLKTGFNYVEVVDNDQLLLYALAKYTTDPGLKEFKLTIIQPNNSILNIPVVNSVDVTIDRLLEEERLLLEAMEAVQNTEEFNPSKIACYYCSFKGECQALLNKTFELLECSTLSENLGQKNVKSMSNNQIAEVLENEPLIKKFLKSVESEAINRIMNGEFIAGFKVSQSQGRRQWVISQEELVEKFKKMGVPKGEMFKQTILSPSQLKNLKWGDGKKISVKQLELMEEYVKREEGGYKLVDIRSKEKSVTDVIESYFQVIK